jgi:hypothetical protein
MHVCACTRPRVRVPSQTHARARMNTQTNKLYLFLFHGNNDSRTRLIVTLYVHCPSCQKLCRFCTEFLTSSSSCDENANEIRFVCKTFAGLCGINQYAWLLVPSDSQLVFCFADRLQASLVGDEKHLSNKTISVNVWKGILILTYLTSCSFNDFMASFIFLSGLSFYCKFLPEKERIGVSRTQHYLRVHGEFSYYACFIKANWICERCLFDLKFCISLLARFLFLYWTILYSTRSHMNVTVAL